MKDTSRPLRILVAPDSFKHSLSASEVCNSLDAGLKKSGLHCKVDSFPMADGGEGTMEALVAATDGTWVEAEAHDPLMRPVETRYGITGDGVTAIIEMAAASGIERLTNEELDPIHATTFGTGELIKHAIKQGCTEVIVGLGGSATVDGGVGFCQALGGRFYSNNGRLSEPGEPLSEIYEVDLTESKKILNGIQLWGACDVTNKLLGDEGAAHVFAPQKGADKKQVEILEQSLLQLYTLLEQRLGVSVADQPGAGAAGGLGAGIVVFGNGTLTSGFELIASRSNLELAIENTDLVITGEGKLDAQTAFGKTPYGVAKLAKEHDRPLFAVAGTLEDGYQALYKKGFDGLFSLAEGPATLDELMKQTSKLLENTGERIGHLLMMQQKYPIHKF
jgi:glycerate kinase